jgi:HSP20 family protein
MFVRPTHVYTIIRTHSPAPSWRPPTDMYETDSGIVVQIEIAGMRDGHFHLSLQDRYLTVYGTRVDPAVEQRAYHQLEIHSGEFRVEVDLPASVARDSIRAEYDDGLLRIILPKLK